jgi:hypothetical protein
MYQMKNCPFCGGKLKGRRCAYCVRDACTDDHVIPTSLYPTSKNESRVQRITVPACCRCNGGWSSDEPHFRNMLLVSGDRTSVVSELWEGPTQRSFTKVDGGKRVRDLVAQMVPVQTPQGARYMVYPGRDERVLRIVRKVVRGLCHYHKLLSPVTDEQVWADVQKFEIAPEFLKEMTSAHVEEDVLQYRFGVIEDPDIHSGWLLQFFTRTPFLCIVYHRPQTLG